MNLGFLGPQDTPENFFGGPSRGSGNMVSRKSSKMEPLRLAKNVFPAYSYCHEVS